MKQMIVKWLAVTAVFLWALVPAHPVRAASAPDRVAVSYVFAYQDSGGRETGRSYAPYSDAYYVDHTRNSDRLLSEVTAPAGYRITSAEIERQECSRADSQSFFGHCGFMEGSGRLLLSFRGLDSAEMEGCERTVTVKLSCAPIQYSVVFDYNGGHGDISGKEVFYHAPYGRLPQGEREGSAFRGWSLDITGEQMVWEDTVVENLSGHVLYAVWETCSYRVSFDAAGGTCDRKECEIRYGSGYVLPVPERAGYTFAGWFTDQGRQVTDSTIMTVAGPHTLHARWENASFEVAFDGNGGSVSSSRKTVTYLGTYGTLPEAERTGYIFSGWFTERDGGKIVTASASVQETGRHTLYAGWKAEQYRILFDPAGGECDTESREVVYGEPYGVLPEPERTGYTFAGWHLDRKRITAGNLVYVTGQSVLVAEWVPKSYEVCFDPDGGSCGEKYRTVTYDALYGTLPEPERKGYTFAGWFLADGNRVTEHTAVTITKDSDLTASWTPNYYRITFNAAGGECGAESWSYAYDDYFKEFPKAVKAGHIFCGWYTSKEGGELYPEGRKVDILSDMTLYAHWEKAEPAPEDDWYMYPDSPDREEKPHRITMEEAAGKYGFTISQIRTAMNLYQMEPGVAGSLLQTAQELGADASLALWDPDVLEKKRSGRDVAGSSFSLFKARIKKATQNSVTITWNRIRGADGYLIYDSRCGRMEHFAFDAETAGTSCTKKGLKKGTYYRFIVTAYALIDGRRVPIAVSTNVHAVTKGGKYANAKKITLKKTHKTMRAGEKWKIKVKVSYGKKQHKTHRKLSFESSDPGVAKVDDRGIVKAAAKGECRIYVYDQGGRFRKIRIKVKG